jgi:hypothetical protein
MDAMSASHDAMMAHMSQVRDAVNGTQVAGTQPITGQQEGMAPLSVTPDQMKDLMDHINKVQDMQQRARAAGKKSEIELPDSLIKLAGDITMMPGAGYPWQVRRTPEETAKLKTHQTLQKALGGGGAKVLPITPTEEEK